MSQVLEQPSAKRKPGKHAAGLKPFRAVRNVFRSFPIIAPAACRLPSLPSGRFPDWSGGMGARVTGTLFGYRRGCVSLSIQENSRTLPTAVVELAMQTQALQKELGEGMVRIALECEKRGEKAELLEEPRWTVFCNGRSVGYGVRREATVEDLHVMEVLKAVSMGAGVLPEHNGPDGDQLAYMRADFDRVVGSRDSETLYMVNPDGSNGPDLSIFFIRV